MKVPLIDYHAAILERRPTDWDGALDKFITCKGYDVPALIARDGVHPGNPKLCGDDLSLEGLAHTAASLAGDNQVEAGHERDQLAAGPGLVESSPATF